MGAIGAIMKYGSERQKSLAADYVLGGAKPAICITEPDAGSASTEMTTKAVKRGDKCIIDGRKHEITVGGITKFHPIFARVMGNGVGQGIADFIAIFDDTRGLSSVAHPGNGGSWDPGERCQLYRYGGS